MTKELKSDTIIKSAGAVVIDQAAYAIETSAEFIFRPGLKLII